MKPLFLTLICCALLLLSPARSFAFETSIAASPEMSSYQQYGPIRYYESLWSVSKKLRPNKTVSVQQTLVAIYKLNPDVFVDGDINHLMENSVINVPPYQLIKQQTNQEAIVLINKYSNLKHTQTGNIKRANENIVKPGSGAEEKNAANSYRSKNKSLENPRNTSLITPATSFPGEAEQRSEENAALLVADLHVSSKANNIDSGTLSEAPSAANAGNASPLQLQTLQNELISVNTQLVNTIAINEDLKSGLHLIINEIDLLKSQIKSENAGQAKLLTLIEQYGIDLNSSQAAVVNKSEGSEQTLSWVSASLTHLLIVVLSPLLIVMLIFWLIFRRNNRRLRAENNKKNARLIAMLSDTKRLPISDNLNFVHDYTQETDTKVFTPLLKKKSEGSLTDKTTTLSVQKSAQERSPRSKTKTADELDHIDFTCLATEAAHIAPAPQDKNQSELETSDLIYQASASELPADNVKADKPDTDDALVELSGDESSDVELSEHIAVIENADEVVDITFLNRRSELADIKKRYLKTANNAAKKAPLTAMFNLKKSKDYIEIETLLQNSESDSADQLYADLDVHLGLDEFPDLLSAHTAIDIDDDEYGINGQLDLARAYLEIDDKRKARDILMASINNSNTEQRKEIDKLLIRL